MPEGNSPEKRKSPRLEGTTFPIEYTLKERSGALKQAKAMSLGESGLMIATEESLPMGAPLRLKLFIPKTLFPFSDWQTVSAEAEIARVHDKTDSGPRHYGVFITKISPQDAASLKDFVSFARWKGGKS